MTDKYKQNENEASGTRQSKAATLYSILSSKFELLARFPNMQVPAWYGLVCLALIIIIFAWKQIAVSQVESDMVRKLENARISIAQEARVYADRQYVKEEERFGQVLSWAVRGELLRNNLDQISQYFNELVKLRDTEIVVLISADGQLLVSTDKRHEDAKGKDLFPVEILNKKKITVESNVDGKKLLVIPIMGLNNRMATVVVTYSPPALN